MSRKSLKETIMGRDGLSSEEADSLIAEAQEDFWDRLSEGEIPWDICEEYFGLEPDWLDEFGFL